MKFNDYRKDEVNFAGVKYTPITDVLLEEEGGLYSSEVEDAKGAKYEAIYTQEHYDNDSWLQPLTVRKC